MSWIRVPRLAEPWLGASPPALVSAQRSRQSPKLSTLDGESRTCCSGRRSGRSSLRTRWTHHCSGSAPPTCTAASRPSAVAAAAAPVLVVQHQPATEVGHEGREGEGAAELGELPLLRGRRLRNPGRVRRRHQGVDEVEVDRRLVVLTAHGADQQPLRGARHRDEEQPRLVVAHRRLRRPERPVAPGHDGDQLLRTQQRAAQPQVGPDALLHTGDRDVAPLATGGAGGRHQRHAVAGLRPRGEGVAGDVLALDVLEERVRPRGREPVDVALRPRRTARRRRRGRGRRERRACRRRSASRFQRSATSRASHTAQRTVSALTPGAQVRAPSFARPCAPRRAPRRSRATTAPTGVASWPSEAAWPGSSRTAASSSSLDRSPPLSSSSRRSSRRSRRSPTASHSPSGESTRSIARSGST